VGAKRALKPRQVWAIRFFMDQQRRVRDRALFDLANESKLRGCDVVKIRIRQLVSGSEIRLRRSSLLAWLERRGGSLDDYASRAASTIPITSARGRMPGSWMNGSQVWASDGRSMASTSSVAQRRRSSTNALLSEMSWRAVTLQRLVDAESARSDHPGSANIAGSNVELPADLVQPIALLLHEMISNAVKRAALRASDGQLLVEWAVVNSARARLERA
jgi:hypothetical protein